MEGGQGGGNEGSVSGADASEPNTGTDEIDQDRQDGEVRPEPRILGESWAILGGPERQQTS